MNWLSSWESFIRVVESGSMAGAARRLDCTRAQISKQISDLERAFAVRLFERSTRKLTLTPSGEIFYQHAQRALESVRSADVAVRNSGDTPRGLMRVSASITFGRMYIAPLLPGLVDRYPELQCELILTDQLVDLFADNIDLALRLTKAPPEDAVARKLVHMRRVICATPAYLALHGEPETPQALLKHPCFSYSLSENDRDWHLADATGNSVHLAVNNRIFFNNIDCVQDAVLAGHGIAILPTYLCAEPVRQGRLKILCEGWEPMTNFGRHLHACYTPSRVRTPNVRVFLDMLAAHFTPVPPWERD